jgi:hypothetical protein
MLAVSSLVLLAAFVLAPSPSLVDEPAAPVEPATPVEAAAPVEPAAAEPDLESDDSETDGSEPDGSEPDGSEPDDDPEAPSEPTPAPTITTEPPPPTPPRAAPSRDVDGLRPVTWSLQHPREHYWVPNSWPVAQPCDFTLTPHRTCLVLAAEVFTGFRYDAVAGRSFNEFRVDRGELGTGLVWQAHERFEAGVVVRLEAIRSAGPQSLVGIDGDSLIVRLLETYGQLVAHLGPVDLGARAGVVPERWIEQVHKGYDTRGIEGTAAEKGQMFDRSDVGATLTASGWKGLVELDLQLVNGEGRAQREQNPGKNTTAMLTVRPLQRRLAKGPLTLAVHGGYRDGSLGVGSLRNHRGAAALTFASPWGYAGFEYAHALGHQARGNVEANALSMWASGHVFAPWVGLMAKYDRIQADLGLRGSVVHAATVGVFSDLFPYLDRNRRRVRLYAAYQHEGYGDTAGPLPGTPQALETHRILLQLQVQGVVRAF